MCCKYSQKVIFLSFLICLSSWAKTREFKFKATPKAAKVESQQNTKKNKKNKIEKKMLALQEGISKQENDRLLIRIQSLTKLIEIKKDANIMQLRTARGTSYYQLSRFQRLKSKDLSQQSKQQSEQYLKSAKSDFEFLLNSGKQSAAQQSYSYYLMGLTYFDLNQYPEGDASLRKAISANPNAPYVFGILTYFADQDAENGRYDVALVQYKKLLSEAEPKEKQSLYRKIYSIYLEQENYKEAEKLALFFLKAKSNVEQRKDDIANLALIDANLYEDAQALEQLQSFKWAPLDQLSFLKNYLLADKNIRRKKFSIPVAEKVLSLEGLSLERIKLRLQLCQDYRRDVLDTLYEKQVQALIAEIKNLSPQDMVEVKKVLLLDLIANFNNYVSLSAALFSEKIRAEQESAQLSLSTAQRGRILINFINWYDGSFKLTNRLELYRLLVDIQASLKEPSEMLVLSKKIIGDPELKEMTDELYLERLIALEELYKKEPTKYRKSLLQTLKICVSKRGYENWKDFANRYVAFLIEDKSYVEAIPLLKEILKVQKSEDALYRLLLAQFQTKNYSEVVSYVVPSEFKSSRIIDMQRESHLIMAQGLVAEKNKKSGLVDKKNFVAYEKSIREFLKLNQDPAKELLVIQNYLNNVSQLGDKKKMAQELLALDVSTRFTPPIDNYVKPLMDECFQDFKFPCVLAFIGEKRETNNESLNSLRRLSYLAMEKISNAFSGENINPDQRSYMLGLLALQSKSYIEDLVKGGKQKDKFLHELSFLENKIRKCEPPFSYNADEIKKYADLIPEEALPQPLRPSEIAMDGFKFPQSKKLSKKSVAEMTKLTEKVKSNRELITKDIAAAIVTVKQRILQKASSTEIKMANMILQAPLPDGLTPEEQVEYKSGIAGVAGDFSNQAQEFKKLESFVAQQIKEKSEKDKIPSLKCDPSDWPWPKSAALQKLKASIPNQSLISLLVVLDYLKSTQEIAASDYWMVRTGILVSKNKCSSLREYIYRELKAEKQDGVLQCFAN